MLLYEIIISFFLHKKLTQWTNYMGEVVFLTMWKQIIIKKTCYFKADTLCISTLNILCWHFMCEFLMELIAGI